MLHVVFVYLIIRLVLYVYVVAICIYGGNFLINTNLINKSHPLPNCFSNNVFTAKHRKFSSATPEWFYLTSEMKISSLLMWGQIFSSCLQLSCSKRLWRPTINKSKGRLPSTVEAILWYIRTNINILMMIIIS